MAGGFAVAVVACLGQLVLGFYGLRLVWRVLDSGSAALQQSGQNP